MAPCNFSKYVNVWEKKFITQRIRWGNAVCTWQNMRMHEQNDFNLGACLFVAFLSSAHLMQQSMLYLSDIIDDGKQTKYFLGNWNSTNINIKHYKICKRFLPSKQWKIYMLHQHPINLCIYRKFMRDANVINRNWVIS